MERPIILLGLPDEAKSKLQALGFDYIEDIERFLKNSEGIPDSLKEIIEKYEVLDKIDDLKNFSTVESAAESLINSNSPVSIFHEGLDKLVDGGLPTGQLTELCGLPGSGKTQMCLQFCVDVRIPQELGGSEGEALFISTDFGFQVERLRQIAQGTIDHFKEIEFSSDAKENIMAKLSVESVLDGIKVLQVYEVKDLFEALGSLKYFFETNQNVKLLVIDSFSLPLIIDVEDSSLRSKATVAMLHLLVDLAVTYKFAVVLTNQLMTVIYDENNSVVKPSLGQTYAHGIHQRLLVHDSKIYVTKSIGQPQIFTNFKITEEGIR